MKVNTTQEHSFADGFISVPSSPLLPIKRVYAMNRSRYVGLQKTAAEFALQDMAYNLTRALGYLADA